MQFNQNAKVISADNKEVGHLERVIIDPETKSLTHITVRKGTINPKEKVVPVDLVAAGVPNEIGLRLPADRLDELSDYEETRVSGGSGGGMHSSFGSYETANAPMTSEPVLKEKIINIPPNTVALKEGAQVNAADGNPVGKIEQVLTGPEDGHVTHLRVTKGLLHKESRLVSADLIARIEEKAVTLSVESSAVDGLPNHDEE